MHMYVDSSIGHRIAFFIDKSSLVTCCFVRFEPNVGVNVRLNLNLIFFKKDIIV